MFANWRLPVYIFCFVLFNNGIQAKSYTQSVFTAKMNNELHIVATFENLNFNITPLVLATNVTPDRILFPDWLLAMLFVLFFGLIFFAFILRRQVQKKTAELKFRSGILQSANTMLEELLVERKKSEVTLRESEEVFRTLFLQSTDALGLIDNGKFIDCNPATLKYMGFRDKKEIVNKSPWELSPDLQPDGRNSREKALELISEAFRKGNHRFEWVHKRADGTDFFTEVVLTVLLFKGKNILHVSWRDISDRKKMEEALKESEAKYRLLIENQTDLIVKVDTQGKFLFVSPSYCKLFGKRQEELLGKNFFPLVHPDDIAATEKAMEDLHKHPYHITLAQRALTVDGWTWIQWVDTAILDEQGQVKEIIGVGRDITEQKKTEQALKESEQRWQFALEGAEDGVWDWDVPSGKVYFSERWKSMLGYLSEEISDSIDEWDRLVHPADKQGCYDALQDHFEGKTPVYVKEHRMMSKDGTYQWILDRGKVVEWTKEGKPQRVIGTHTNITSLKNTEGLLIERQKFIQTILDNLPIGVAVNEFDSGKASYMNVKFAEIYGWPREKLISIESFFELVYPDEKYRNALSARIMADIESGDPSRMKWDNIIVTSESGEKRVVLAVNIPLLDQNVMVSTVQDVTAQKNAERVANLLNAQLEEKVAERTSQLEAINKELEAFSYSVSHDLRAPLRAITGFSQIINDEYKDVLDNEGIRLFTIIQENACSMDKLILDLLEFSRTGRTDMNKSVVNVQNMVQTAVDHVARDYNKDQFKLDIKKLPEAWADHSLLQQVWINLISNAFKFSSSNENPAITIGGDKANGECTYYVKDNGVGFSPEYKDKIFQVFQRLHKAGEFEGTGVGLAIVKRIVYRHGGKVWADSTPGQGSSFYFTLPVK
jgi:PAS domain S-box-containing protein